MNITAAQVNELRQMTGAGMMDCKKALVECNGDKEAAIDYLRKKGQKIALKRADREATEGCVISKSTEDHKFTAVIMLNCETDFVGTNSDFIGLTKKILDYAVENRIKDIETLKTVTINGLSIDNMITDLTGKTGEKIQLGKYLSIEAPYVTNYNHQGNALAAIIGMNKLFNGVEEIAHEVALQVAAMDPIAIDENDVPQATKDNEYAIAMEKTKQEQIQKAVEVALKKVGINPAHVDSEEHIESNKTKGWITEADVDKAREIKERVSAEKAKNMPEQMLHNIVKGRLAKFYKENCLLDQNSLIAEGKSIREYIQAGDKEATVIAFKRVKLG